MLKTNKNIKTEIKPFTKKEYIPGYMCMDSFYITYDLKNRTIKVDGRTKKMNDYYYNKALQYVERGDI